METEYEQFILTKLRNRIRQSKPFPLKTKLERLVELLDKKATQSVDAEALAQRKEIIVSLNSFLDESHTIFGKKGSYSFNTPGFIYKLHKSLKKFKQELQGNENVSSSGTSNSSKEAADHHRGESSSLVNKFQGIQWSCPLVDASKVHGFDEKVDILERRLLQAGADDDSYDKFQAVGIIGTHGVGKTTLCQVLLTRKEVINHFVPRIWVCMSNQPNEDEDNRKEIVTRLLTSLGVEEENIAYSYTKYGLQGLLLALHLKLMGKRYLIVLDGAWSTDCFYEKLNSELNRDETMACEKLARGLPKGYGGTVIVTSSYEEVARNMVGGEEDLYHLLPLSDPGSCWRIFNDAVEEDGGVHGFSVKDGMKEQIIHESGGLPLFINMMGQLMREKLEKTHISREADEHEEEIHQEQ